MQLLERYLQTVGFWLPRKQQDDILQELAEDIRSQIEDKETKLGRSLDEAEIAEVLKQRGQPMLVAARYLPRGHLIGPPWFQLYCFVTKVVLLWVLLPLFILIAGGAAITAFASGANPGLAILRTLGGFWVGTISAFGSITIVFALLDRWQHRIKLNENFDPRKLPALAPARDKQKISRAGSIGELAWGVLLIAWWLDWLRVPVINAPNAGLVKITMAPVWQHFYWPILLLFLVGAATSAVNVCRPWWTPLRASIRLGIDIATIVLTCLVLRTGPWIEITVSKLSGPVVEQVRQSVNFGMVISLASIAIIYVFGAIDDAHRAFRKKTNHPAGGVPSQALLSRN